VRKFEDKTGQAWEIELTIGAVTNLRKNTRFNLYEPFGGEPPLIAVLYDDPESLFELLVHLLEGQLKTRGLTAEQFGALLASDCFSRALIAFMEEWEDFARGLQRLQQAELMGALMKQHLASMEAAARLIPSLRTKLSEEFGKALESLGSIPSGSPGETSTTCSAAEEESTAGASSSKP
jgi:hypothetical protein